MRLKRTLIYIIQIILFIPLQIVFVPLAIVGIFLGVYKELILGKKLGVSYSAGQTLQYRYYMHYLGTREDQNTVEFVKHYPCESHFALFSILGAFILSKRWFGFTTTLSKLPSKGKESLDKAAAMRLLAFDGILNDYVGQVDQVVIPGVGYDLIALSINKKVSIYEIDQKKTMLIKQSTLIDAGIQHSHINYIPVDYSSESWSEKLVEAGFDKSKKTLFIWQSVSHFLEEDLVKDTLSQMKNLSSSGSIIAQDFYDKNFISGNTHNSVKSQKKMMAKNGEPWVWGIDMSNHPKEAVENFLSECGLDLSSYYGFGEDLDISPYYCIVTSKV